MGRVYSIIRSFRYAIAGLSYALKTQRNMRIHFSAGAFAVAFAYFYGFTAVEWVALMFTITFVIVCEMFNTAIENAVNVATSTYHHNAKIAKDVAAGAVMMSALLALAVAARLFFDVSKLVAACVKILSNGWYICGFLIGAVLSVWWILLPGRPPRA